MGEPITTEKPRLKQIRYDLRKKISTIMTVVLLINAALLLVYITWSSKDLEERHILKYGTEALQLMDNFIKTRSGSIVNAPPANSGSARRGTRAAVEDYLNSLQEAIPYFRFFMVFDDNGKLLITSKVRGEAPQKPSLATLNKLYQQPETWRKVLRITTRKKETVFLLAELQQPAVDWSGILFSVMVIVALALASMLSTFRWAQKMARPLREVIQVADEVSQGQAFREVKARSSDEAGVIAGLFNDINKRLQDRINDMAMLQLWSMDIGAELDREALNNLIVTTFANATGARRVALLLREKGAGLLTVAAGIHVTNPRLSFPDNTGITGEALTTENQVTTSSLAGYADASLFYADPAAAPAGIWFLALPVIAQGKAIGVLVLGDRAVDGDKEFDAEAVILFQTLATSAGSALDNARLYELAITDELTRVYIRRFYNQRLNEEIDKAANEQAPLSLIMLDIDHFKRFNDTFGHQTGDRVLIALAHLLRETVRGMDVQGAERRRDIVARYGGEEFSLILPNTPLAGGLLVAERLRHNIESFQELRSDDGKVLSVTISLGVAEWQPGQQPEHLIHCADEALYEAKHRGRNRVVGWPFAGAESAPPA
ncbi:MAG TPA: diguanylate cyclase [bacterium]|nr:diguanylate cyclase [bacterium]